MTFVQHVALSGRYFCRRDAYTSSSTVELVKYQAGGTDLLAAQSLGTGGDLNIREAKGAVCADGFQPSRPQRAAAAEVPGRPDGWHSKCLLSCSRWRLSPAVGGQGRGRMFLKLRGNSSRETQ